MALDLSQFKAASTTSSGLDLNEFKIAPRVPALTPTGPSSFLPDWLGGNISKELQAGFAERSKTIQEANDAYKKGQQGFAETAATHAGNIVGGVGDILGATIFRPISAVLGYVSNPIIEKLGGKDSLFAKSVQTPLIAMHETAAKLNDQAIEYARRALEEPDPAKKQSLIDTSKKITQAANEARAAAQSYTDQLARGRRAAEVVRDVAPWLIGGSNPKESLGEVKQAVDTTKTLADNTIQAVKDLQPTAESIAAERQAKISKGLEEQNVRLKTADKSFTDNTIVRQAPDGKKITITPIDTFAKYNIAPVIEKGGIQMGDYRTGTGELGKIKEKVSELDNQIDTKLVNDGTKIDLENLRQDALEAVRTNEDFKRSGSVAQNTAKVEARFGDYLNSYGPNLDIAELNNIRKVANKDFSPDTVDTSKIVGDVARKSVYDITPNGEIKSLLQQQGELLAARKYAERINGTKVVGGRLGTMALRTTGAVIGTGLKNLPVIGPILGAIGGEYASRLLQQSQFKSAWTELKALIAKEPQSNNLEQTQRANNTSQNSNMPNVTTKEDIQSSIPKDTTLKGEEAVIQDKAIEKYASEKDAMVDKYIEDNGKVVNADEARKYFADVGYNGTNSRAVQEASSALSKAAWKKLLETTDKPDVLLYAGGSGTGKTTAVRNFLPTEVADAGVIFDGNLSSMKSAKARIQESLDANKNPTVVYVYRDPIHAWVKGVISRMLNNKEEGGRVVPLSVFLENHRGSYDVVKSLLKDSFNGKYFNVKLVDNSLGAEKQRLLTKAKFDKISYPESLKQTLLDKTKELYDKGTITKEQYEALTK